MADHDHLWVNDGDRIVCAHCEIGILDPQLDHPSQQGGPMATPLQEPVQKLLDSLEPDEVDGYTVSNGYAFDGITLHGHFDTFEEAMEYVESGKHLEEWHIVPLWKP